MTADQRRTAILEFARGRLPEGAKMEPDPDGPRGGCLDIFFGDESNDTAVRFTVYFGSRSPIRIFYSAAAQTTENTRLLIANMKAALALAEAIEVFARGLPGEERAPQEKETTR